MDEVRKLGCDEIHLWTIPLHAPDPRFAELRALLSADEAERMGRFRFEHLQRSYAVSRGALRLLLGGYTGEQPAGLQFSYGPKGKPALAGGGPVRFNIAHSGDMGLFAFTLDCELGTDIERLRPLRDMAGIARRFFCAEEAQDLMSLPPDDREAAFFRCWTRKEAYIKAVGDGLSIPLDSFRVTLLPGEPTRFLHLAHDEAAAKDWTLTHVEGPSGYTGAIAHLGEPRKIRNTVLKDAAALFDYFAEFR